MAKLWQLSKFLSYVLRHKAHDFNIPIDEQGYAALEDIVTLVINRFHERYSKDDILSLVESGPDGKKRYDVSGDRIRALYGHSKVKVVTGDPVGPPDILYHGTSPHVLEQINREGLKGMKRRFVHLSMDTKRAEHVGRRHSKPELPVILKIKAKEAHKAGIKFFHPEKNHFLCKSIPAEYICFPDKEVK